MEIGFKNGGILQTCCKLLTIVPPREPHSRFLYFSTELNMIYSFLGGVASSKKSNEIRKAFFKAGARVSINSLV